MTACKYPSRSLLYALSAFVLFSLSSCAASTEIQESNLDLSSVNKDAPPLNSRKAQAIKKKRKQMRFK